MGHLLIDMAAVKVVRRIRTRYRTTPSCYIVVYLVGANIGLLAFISKPSQTIKPVFLTDLLQSTAALNSSRNSSIAELLRNLVELHCVIVREENDTSAYKEEQEARITWAKGCNSFSMASRTSQMALWPNAVAETFQKHGETADWFLFVSGRAFVVAENARLFLLPFSKERNKALVFGSKTEDGILPCVLMSRRAALRIKMKMQEKPSCARGSHFSPKYLMKCLYDLGIEVLETRDHLRRHRILPLPPSEFQNPRTSTEINSLIGLVHPIFPGVFLENNIKC
ncbi:hypothetical protein RB195_009560 [Necator americanus]|uniref:Uncharacterized protein n=1 Tax=Necator americanus TaxID=51031 RepID=A0ABR1CWC8_NECAM